MNEAIFYWLISFIIPILLLLTITKIFNKYFVIGSWKQNIIILLFVLISGVIAVLFLKQIGIIFSLTPKIISLTLFIISGVVSYILVGKFGLFYIISVIIQEFCLLANALLLFQVSTLTISIILIAPVYALSHLQTTDKWKIKLLATIIWGVITIVTFYYVKDIYLNMSIHLISGAILIKKGLLFTRTKK